MITKTLMGERETEYRGWIVQARVTPSTATVKAINGGCEIFRVAGRVSERSIALAMLTMRNAIDVHPLTIALNGK